MSNQNMSPTNQILQSPVVFDGDARTAPPELERSLSTNLQRLQLQHPEEHFGTIFPITSRKDSTTESESQEDGSVGSSTACSSLTSSHSYLATQMQHAQKTSSPNKPQKAFRFTPPMCLQHFPRPANLSRTDSSPTVLEQRYQVSMSQVSQWLLLTLPLASESTESDSTKSLSRPRERAPYNCFATHKRDRNGAE